MGITAAPSDLRRHARVTLRTPTPTARQVAPLGHLVYLPRRRILKQSPCSFPEYLQISTETDDSYLNNPTSGIIVTWSSDSLRVRISQLS